MAGGTRIRIPLFEAGAIWAQSSLAGPARPLTPDEKTLLLKIFGSSINLDSVQTVYTTLGVEGRPYTFGNTIRIPPHTKFDAATLVHETTHVWQYQTMGTAYLSDSAFHQLTQGSKAYDVQLVPGKSFFDYTAEQQAMIVQKYYEDSPPGWQQNPDVLRMLNEVRGLRPLSPSQIEHETWFGPNPSPWDNPIPGKDTDQGQTVPLIRIEFP
ncbi:MAG TPA: hypothetical protein VNU92_06180 [Edaphobacter sp.]|nr:hypothetical protein [Edaphobacter sp.]